MGFFKILKKIAEALFINLLWLIFSIPVFTIGAATSAAFSVTLKILNDEEDNVAKMFVKAFRSNFKQGTIMWCITAPCICACYFIWNYIIKDGDAHFLIKIAAVALTIVSVCVNLYSYSILSRYENPLKKTILNSTVICMIYIWRTAVICAVITVECILIFLNRWTMLAGILIGPELIIFTITIMSKKVFQTIEKNGGVIVPAASTSEEADEDDAEDDADDDDEETDVSESDEADDTEESDDKNS